MTAEPIHNTRPSLGVMMPVWRSGNVLRLDQRSHSVPGPVSAWTGDNLCTGKPPEHRTTHPGRLSLSHHSVGRQQWVLAVAPVTTGEESSSPA